MKNGIYVVQTKGFVERELVKIYEFDDYTGQQVTFFNDPDSSWNIEQLLESCEVICRLDLYSFEREDV
jgi:hypothetical protein